MALLLRPHTATKMELTRTSSGGNNVYDREGWASNGTVRGQLDEISSADAMQEWGMELKIASRWFCNNTDAASIQQGMRLVVNSVNWVVMAGPLTRSHGHGLDHSVFLLERGQVND